MSNPVKIAFFAIDGDLLGGGGKMLIRLLERLDKDRFEPILVVQKRGKIFYQAKELNIRTEVIPFEGILALYGQKLLSTDFFGKIRTGLRILQYNVNVHSVIRKADVVWCENLRMVLTLLPWANLSSIPFIWNIGLGLESEGLVERLNSVALRLVEHVFIESELQARATFTNAQYEEYQKKFTVFHKGIDTDNFDPGRFDCPDTDSYRIGTAATLTARKGIIHIIDALPPLIEDDKDIKLFIAGRSPNNDEEYYQLLQNRIHNHGLEDHVEFVGWVDDMPSYLHSLDVFVLPSLNEGIPGVVKEALSMKLPVVATDVGGTSDLVLDGHTGILTEPEQHRDITRAVRYLITNPTEASEMGKRGRRHVQSSFSIKNYVVKYERFISEIHG